MGTLNRAILLGNLGADPEMRYTQGGTPVCNFRVATSDVRQEKGQSVETTEWHTIVAWAKLAEQCAEYLRKGRAVLVEGRIRSREFQDSHGATRRVTEIHADRVVFLGGGGDGSPARRAEASERAVDDDLPF